MQGFWLQNNFSQCKELNTEVTMVMPILSVKQTRAVGDWGNDELKSF